MCGGCLRVACALVTRLSDIGIMRALDTCGAAACPDRGVELDAFQRLSALRDVYLADKEAELGTWREWCTVRSVDADARLGECRCSVLCCAVCCVLSPSLSAGGQQEYLFSTCSLVVAHDFFAHGTFFVRVLCRWVGRNDPPEV